MSPAVETAVTPALDLEGLRLKLLGLRAEIDAILVQLAPPAAAVPHQEATDAADVPAEEMSAPAERIAAAPAEVAAVEVGATELVAVAGEPEADLQSGSEAAMHTADAGETSSAEPPIEVVEVTVEAAAAAQAPAPASGAEEPSEGLATIVETQVLPDGVTAVEPERHHRTEAAETHTQRADAEVDALALIVAGAAPEATAPVMSADCPEGAVAAVERPVPAEAALPPAAEVIPIDSRQRKEKAALAVAAGPAVQAPRRRRVAARIAAGIVAIMAAGATLVVADRGMLSGAQALPWMSQMPSSQMPWSFQIPWPFPGQDKRAERAVDAGVAAAGAAAASEALLSRYREVWPMSP
jgi:hypothetical protein